MAANGTRSRSFQEDGPQTCAKEWVEDSPFASMTVLFGVGVAVGLLLGHTIAESAGRRLFHEDTLTEKLTGQIRNVLKSNLPASLSQHLS